MIWEKKNIDSDAVKGMAKNYNLNVLTSSILYRRGLTESQDLKYYIENDLRFLHNPFLFNEMETVVERIMEAVAEQEVVMIFGDRDVDGITSTVMLYETLRGMGLAPHWALPMGDEPYGLTMEAVDKFAEMNGSLIITVDCGISNYKEIAYAAEKQIDAIIIDHHIPPEELPPATAIINPKLEDDGYPFRDLAGCGVAGKVIWALGLASTDIYKQTFCLLNILPGNDSYILEAVKLYNMMEVDRITETLVPGLVNLEQTRLVPFLEGQEILVYDAETQLKMFRKALGPGVDIHLNDIAVEIWKTIPQLEGQSLFSLKERSRIGRYAETGLSEIDILLNLCITFLLKREPNITKNFEEFLDLIAVGTLADLMPLKDENRIIVRRGMEVLNSTPCRGIRELLIRQNLYGKRLSTTDIGWQVSPLINATGRLGVPHTAVELFLSENPEERQALADKVIGLNKERKKLGENGWQRVLPKAKRSFEELDHKMIIAEDKELNRGITGILATRLANTFKVPAVIIARLDDKAIGSIRSSQHVNVKNFLSLFSDHFLDFGGHDYAAGFSLELDKLPQLMRSMEAEARRQDFSMKGEEKQYVDAELPGEYMTPELTSVVEFFEPYGEGNPPLVFLARGVYLRELDLMGRKERVHVRMLIDSGKFKWPAVFWSAADRVKRDFDLNDKVDLLFRLGRNYYQSTEKLQLTVIDIQRSSQG